MYTVHVYVCVAFGLSQKNTAKTLISVENVVHLFQPQVRLALNGACRFRKPTNSGQEPISVCWPFYSDSF